MYNPPTSESLVLLETNLDDIMPHYTHVIVLGGFNINMQVANSKSDSLLEFCGCLGLDLVSYKSTHHTVSSHSWIDHCLVSESDLVVSSRQSSEPFLADHALISIKYDYSLPSTGRKKICRRNWARIDDNDLHQVCLGLNLSHMDCDYSVDAMNSSLHAHMENVINKVAPLKEIMIRDQPAPWINQDIKNL